MSLSLQEIPNTMLCLWSKQFNKEYPFPAAPQGINPFDTALAGSNICVQARSEKNRRSNTRHPATSWSALCTIHCDILGQPRQPFGPCGRLQLLRSS